MKDELRTRQRTALPGYVFILCAILCLPALALFQEVLGALFTPFYNLCYHFSLGGLYRPLNLLNELVRTVVALLLPLAIAGGALRRDRPLWVFNWKSLFFVLIGAGWIMACGAVTSSLSHLLTLAIGANSPAVIVAILPPIVAQLLLLWFLLVQPMRKGRLEKPTRSRALIPALLLWVFLTLVAIGVICWLNTQLTRFMVSTSLLGYFSLFSPYLQPSPFTALLSPCFALVQGIRSTAGVAFFYCAAGGRLSALLPPRIPLGETLE